MPMWGCSSAEVAELRPRSMLDLLLGLESRCPKVGYRVETRTPVSTLPFQFPRPLLLALCKKSKRLRGAGADSRGLVGMQRIIRQGEKRGMRESQSSLQSLTKVQCQHPVGVGA